MSYQDIQKQIFSKIRGSESQLSLNTQLGFKSNRVNKWETGQRQIKWSEFVRLCELKSIPIEKSLHFCLKTLNRKFNHSSSQEVIKQFFLLYGFKEQDSIARRLRVHPSVLRRWVSGKVEADLESILQIFDLVNDFLDLFLDMLLGDPLENQQEVIVSDDSSESRVQLELVSHHPWMLAIIAALETKIFHNMPLQDVAKLADFLGMDLALIQRSLDLMTQALILERGPQNYKLLRARFNFSNLPLADIVRPMHFWNDRVLERVGSRLQRTLKDSKGYCYFSDFRVLSVSEDEIDQLNLAITEFVGKITSLAQSPTEKKEKVSVIMLHHCDPAILNPDPQMESRWRKKVTPLGH